MKECSQSFSATSAGELRHGLRAIPLFGQFLCAILHSPAPFEGAVLLEGAPV